MVEKNRIFSLGAVLMLTTKKASAKRRYLGNALTYLLLLIIIALVYLLYQNLIGFQQHKFSVKTGNAATTTSDFTIPLEVFVTHPESHYSVIVQQPLFNENRQKFIEPIVKKVEQPLGIYLLTGVLVTPDKRFAILKNTKTGEQTQIPEGNMLNKWRVFRINDDGVILKSGSRTEHVLLDEDE
jgi:hypothetical protein